MVRKLIFSSVVLLAGCGSPERAAEAPANEVATVVEQSVVNTTAPAEAQTAPGTLPAAFRGRWGMGPNDCDPARDDAKGLMVVEPATLRFYESRATVRSAAAEGDTVRLALDFTGEGQTWSVDSTLALEDGGKALARTDRGEQPGTFRYARCPG